MSEQNKQILLNCAKGSWQREIIRDFIKYGTISNPIYNLRGKARSYNNSYKTSFISLKNRIKQAGFNLIYTPGVRGGDYTATYTLLT
jgi:hypothetical protein